MEIDNLNLYSGVSNIIEDTENFVFLVNLLDFNNIISVCYVDKFSNLLKVEPLDIYQNVDVKSDFLKLTKLNQGFVIFFENRDRSIIINRYNKMNQIDQNSFTRTSNSYGVIIDIEGNKNPTYVKSQLKYNSKNHKSYTYEYVQLNNNLNLIARVKFDLGELYPIGINFLNRNIFFYNSDNRLYYYSLDDKTITSIYGFDSDILDIKLLKDNLLILLNDSLFIINEFGEVIKGFNFGNIESIGEAKSLVSSTDSSIVVEFYNNKFTTIQRFSIYGNPLDDFKIKNNIVGGMHISNNSNSNIIIYSNERSVFLHEWLP